MWNFDIYSILIVQYFCYDYVPQKSDLQYLLILPATCGLWPRGLFFFFYFAQCNMLTDLRFPKVSTHGGSVRMTTSALERLQYEQNNSGGSTGRAVENTYTYTWRLAGGDSGQRIPELLLNGWGNSTDQRWELSSNNVFSSRSFLWLWPTVSTRIDKFCISFSQKFTIFEGRQ